MSDLSSAKRKKGGRRERPSARPPKQPLVEEPQEELTPEQYHELKDLFLTRAALSERQYIKFRTRLRDVKMKEAEDYKKMVEEQQCPEFLAAKREAEELRDRKQSINQATKDIRMAKIADEFEAETAMNATQFDDHYVYSKERFIEYYKELIAEKKRRDREVTEIMAAMLKFKPTLLHPVYEAPALTAIVYEGRQTRSRSRSIAREQEGQKRVVDVDTRKKSRG